MLKIKELVDLKELERYGLKHNNSSECYVDDYDYQIIIIYQNREMIINLYEIGFSSLFEDLKKANNRALRILYDLIKADLVECVENE